MCYQNQYMLNVFKYVVNFWCFANFLQDLMTQDKRNALDLTLQLVEKKFPEGNLIDD
jgi:hypothetical protein